MGRRRREQQGRVERGRGRRRAAHLSHGTSSAGSKWRPDAGKRKPGTARRRLVLGQHQSNGQPPPLGSPPLLDGGHDAALGLVQQLHQAHHLQGGRAGHYNLSSNYYRNQLKQRQQLHQAHHLEGPGVQD